MSPKLAGRKALITGAGGGIGLAIVLLMYRNRRSIDLTQADLLKG